MSALTCENYPAVIEHAMSLTDDAVLVAQLCVTRRGEDDARSVIGEITHRGKVPVPPASPLAWWAGASNEPGEWTCAVYPNTLLDQVLFLRQLYPGGGPHATAFAEWLHLNELFADDTYQEDTHTAVT